MPPELCPESIRNLIEQASPLPTELRQPHCKDHAVVFRCAIMAHSVAMYSPLFIPFRVCFSLRFILSSAHVAPRLLLNSSMKMFDHVPGVATRNDPGLSLGALDTSLSAFLSLSVTLSLCLFSLSMRCLVRAGLSLMFNGLCVCCSSTVMNSNYRVEEGLRQIAGHIFGPNVLVETVRFALRA